MGLDVGDFATANGKITHIFYPLLRIHQAGWLLWPGLWYNWVEVFSPNSVNSASTRKFYAHY